VVAGKQVVICCTGRPLGLKAEKRPSIAHPSRSLFGKLLAYPFAVANVSATPSANNKVVVSDDSADDTLLAKQAVRQMRPRRTPRR
tara:strand:- start:755 stop:1012 length:258 start_codon:yes stop_codon:yes gene_type:complete